MDWDWNAIGVIVAMIAVAASFGVTLRGQVQDREIAENSAKRSEAAAGLTADNTERIIAAVEALARQGTLSASGASIAVPLRVRWSLRHQKGDSYILDNIGDATAHAVKVEHHPSLITRRLDGTPDDLQAGEALTFMAMRSMATSDSTIAVSWEDSPGGSRSEWRYPLPPR